MITDSKQKNNKGLAKIQALRQEALTVLYGKLAAEQQEVKDFREIVLDNALLKWDEVTGWIEQQTEDEEQKRRQNKQTRAYITFPLPAGTEFKEDKTGFSFDPPLTVQRLDVQQGSIEFSVKTVAYTRPNDSCVYRKAAMPGGVLEKLTNLSKRLVKRYGWEDYQATVFILAGVTPQISSAKVRPTTQSDLASANRIELSLDPALTEKEVAAEYRQVRRRLLKKDKLGKARFRQLSEKHLRLAIFDAEHDGTYNKKMRAWNKRFPKWKYEHLSNFSRDCRKAAQRLLEPDYFNWKGVTSG